VTVFAASILVALAAAGMPEAPTRVKYTLEKGDVIFDHAGHVARRETCRTCHGEGAVRKIELDQKSAHVLCVGCHLKVKVGPKACGQCHIDA
jgi:DnaJ-class molecular chaperone